MVFSGNLAGTRPLALVDTVSSSLPGDAVLIVRGTRLFRLPLSALGSIGGATSLGALTDVSLNATADSQVLKYSGVSSSWVNASLAEASGIDINDIGYDVILVAGQSNALGRGLTYDAILDDLNSDQTFQFPATGTYADKEIPLKHPVAFPTPDPDNKIGFILSFCRQYIRSIPRHRSVLVVPMAVGGTGFQDNRWGVGDDLYNNTVAQTNQALALPNSRLVAILWHQGESDVGNATYEDDLDATLEAFRLNITGAENVPIILGQMVPAWVNGNAGREAINEIITQTPVRLVNTRVVTTTGLTSNGGGDTIHFSATAQRQLGKLYFEKFLEVAYGDNLTPSNIDQPVLSGTLEIGGTLSVTNGTWTNSPTEFSYLWRRNAVTITGENDNSYQLTTADYGAVITCLVTANNSNGGSSASSNSLLVPDPVAILSPVLHYDASVVSSITVTDGAITQVSDLSGNGYHSQTTVAGQRPFYDLDSLNRPRIRFAGGQILVTAYDQLSRTDTICTVIIISRRANVNIGYLIHSDGVQGTDNEMGFGLLYNLFVGEVNNTRLSLGGGVAVYPTIGLGTTARHNVIRLNRSTNTATWDFAGTDIAITPGDKATNGLLTFGARTPSSPGAFFHGDIYEAAIYDRILTPEEVTLALDYLDTKWTLGE